jgi:hypothetical protein
MWTDNAKVNRKVWRYQIVIRSRKSNVDRQYKGQQKSCWLLLDIVKLFCWPLHCLSTLDLRLLIATWYCQTFLLTFALSVHIRITASDYYLILSTFLLTFVLSVHIRLTASYYYLISSNFSVDLCIVCPRRKSNVDRQCKGQQKSLTISSSNQKP